MPVVTKPVFKGLQGVCVLNPRESSSAVPLTRLLKAVGATVVCAPLLAFAPPSHWAPFDAGIQSLTPNDWVVFTSTTALQASVKRLHTLGLGLNLLKQAHTLAVGPATAKAMVRQGLPAPRLPGRGAYHQQGVLQVLQEVLGAQGLGASASQPWRHTQKNGPPPRVFFPKAQQVHPALEAGLADLGIEVLGAPVYRNVRPAYGLAAVLPQLLAGEVDWLVCTSASVVKHFVASLPNPLLLQQPPLARLRFASLGEATTQALGQHGLRADAFAKTATLGNVVRALIHQQHSPRGALK